MDKGTVRAQDETQPRPGETGRDRRMPAFGARRIGRVNALGLWTLYKKEVWRFLKVWLQTIAAPAAQALFFFIIFAIVLGGSGRASTHVPYPQFLAPGLVIMAVLQNAFANTSSSLIISKVQGTIIDVLMPPLSAGELTFGYVMGGVTRGVLLALALVGAFLLLPFKVVIVHDLAAIAYFGVTGAVMLALIGVITGIWAFKFDHVATITNFVVAPLTLLSGTFYSVARLKESLGGAAHVLDAVLALNPFFYVIDGFRYGFIGEADSPVALGAAVVLAVDVVLWTITWRLLARGWRLKP